MADYRVSPPRVFPGAVRAPRPPAGAAGAADAHRQTGFVLANDVDLVLHGLEVEGAIAAASADAKHRTQPMAAALGQWSRAWLTRLQTLHAVEWGNYAAAMPLVRAAAGYEAASILLLRTDAAEWRAWLDEGGIALAPAQHATEFRLHAFYAAEVLAAHETLGPLYRAVTDLALPHFGATLLLAGSDSDPARVAMTFGDRDFHVGLAELCLGWLLELGAAQLDAVIEAGGVFAIPDPAAAARAAREARAAAASADRCRAEPVDVDGMPRLLVHNWRRAPGAAPKRIVL